MSDHEPVAINTTSLEKIPNPWNDAFSEVNLPPHNLILEELYHVRSTGEPPGKDGEVIRAKQSEGFIEMADSELDIKVTDLVDSCLKEMLEYETIARESPEKRLAKLKQIAPYVTHIIDRSAPGDYYHLNKDDKYKDDPVMQGADRVRSDQTAILTIVLSGIKENWLDRELLLFLNQHVLLNDNEGLNALREKAKEAVRKSGIRLVYNGREDEVKAIKTVLNQKNIFIPKECVDFLGPEGIINTIDQTKMFAEYLKRNLNLGDAFLEAINLQGIRASRFAQAFSMTPPDTNYFIYAMPTVKDDRSLKYRNDEIRGTVFYALTGKASFDPCPHELI